MHKAGRPQRRPVLFESRKGTMTKLTTIPGIGKTFEKDFARIGLHSVEDVANANAEEIFARLSFINTADHHKTSKNYLYVIRMVIYYANGGRDSEKLKWSAWKDVE
jgi:adenine-specific DNA glycosylase